MLKIILLFIFIIAIHAIYNLINFLRYKSIEKLLLGLYSKDDKIRDKSISLKNVILNYIKCANVSNKYIPYTQAVGHGHINYGKASIFDNITINRQDIAASAYEMILEAKGNYWSRFANSINPFYWIRIILFIPKHICTYLGINADSIIIKLFQLLYWFIGIIFTVLTTVYTSEIKDLINSFINIP